MIRVHLLAASSRCFADSLPPEASRKYLQIFAIISALAAVIEFVYGNSALLGILEHHKADMWLHIAITVVAPCL
jgi:hypothetical protein